MFWLLVSLTACVCSEEAPVWSEIDPVFLDGESVTIDLSEYAFDSSAEGLTFAAEEDTSRLIAEVSGSLLTLTPQPDFVTGETELTLTATDPCENTSSTALVVNAGDEADAGDCVTTLTVNPGATASSVSVAGTFNDWSDTAHPMTDNGDGTWSIDLDLDAGAYPYKLVTNGSSWQCDPSAPFIQCDGETGVQWSHACAPGVESCNSMLVVEPCGPPKLELVSLEVDRDANTVTVEVEATPGGAGDIDTLTATLDDTPVEGWDSTTFTATLEGLSEGRHTLRFGASSGDLDADEVYVPFWTDDFSWRDGVMYFAFVDRLANGDTTIDSPEGASAATGDYEGGDIQGLIELLPYLDDLGVTVLWLSNMQDNAEGAWAGDCSSTYAGYHAYWPDDATGVEEHFGDQQALENLIDAAHARGMRVIMDWVANHVHDTHPYYADHPEWFNSYAGCKDFVNGTMNFDRIPETCWFAPYLPDIDYSQPEPLVLMVDDAVWWAKTYELDGFRVDAVKHMSHAVTWNLRHSIEREITHVDAGGDEIFWTVGETFSGADAIKAYVGPNQLDGQFDFPIYWTMRAALLDDSTPLSSLVSEVDASAATYGPDALMSTFLGNHDVARWVTDGTEGNLDPCSNGSIVNAGLPSDSWVYQRMKLGWTFLFTMPGTPLIYYGDELGIPGYNDPDNRQPLWWYAGGSLDGVDSVESLATKVDSKQADVLRHVKTLAEARAAHPALRQGTRVQWWEEADLYAYALTSGADQALVILNRSESERTLSNGVAFAGLGEGTYTDVLTSETFSTSGDNLTVTVPARGSRVLVRQ